MKRTAVCHLLHRVILQIIFRCRLICSLQLCAFSGTVFLHSTVICIFCYPCIIELPSVNVFCRAGKRIYRNGKHNVFSCQIGTLIAVREFQVQILCLPCFHSNDTILKSIDEGTGSDHQIVGITASAVKLLAVNFSNIGNIGGVAFLYGGVRIVHGDSCLCHNGRLYVIIRYLLYFLFQCQLFVISKRYTLCRINFLIDNRNPVYITRGSVFLRSCAVGRCAACARRIGC